MDSRPAATMTVCQKLMLNAEFLPMEASCSFEQLYTVPILQMLGMPMSLVSLTGLTSGAPALILLPMVGWIIDRGSNPRRRRTTAMIFLAGILLLGMSLLIAANVMHLMDLMDYTDTPDPADNHSFPWNASVFSESFFPEKRMHFVVSSMSENDIRSKNNSFLSSGLPFGGTHVTGEILRGLMQNDTGQDKTRDESLTVPLKAGLGFSAFIFLGIGFDGINSFTRTFILTCIPRSEHTSVLLVALVMASAGGVSTAALGVVDYASLLGMSHIEGGSLSIQVIVQGMAVMLFVVLGLLTTLLTGRYQLKHSPQRDAFTMSDHDQEISHDNRYQCYDQVSRGSMDNTDENSNISYSDSTFTLLDESQSAGSSERTPLLANIYNACRTREDILQPHTSSLSGTNGTQECASAVDQSELSAAAENTSEYVSEYEATTIVKDADLESQEYRFRGFKAKIACICIASFFSAALIFMFTYSTADFVGKAIFGGDPHAPPGSESLARYQESVRIASWGLLIYYLSYLLISVVHSRILALLGYRVEFVLTHMLLALSLLTLALTARLEVFFVTAVVAGFQRACFYFVPYAVINDVVQSMAHHSRDGNGKYVGLAMSLVSASVPLAYCTVYTLVGPLEDLTGMVSAPLWMGAGLGCLSSASFLFLGQI